MARSADTNSTSMISTFELFQLFSDPGCAQAYLESQRWPAGLKCPACGESRRVVLRNDGLYRCNACFLDFSVRTGTIFERSKVSCNRWLYAIYLLATTRNKITSLQLATQIGVTDISAQFMVRRLRDACGDIPLNVFGQEFADPLSALDAIASRVLFHRPANKGHAVSTAVAKAEEARKLKMREDSRCP